MENTLDKYKVLIVDDDTTLLKMGEALLGGMYTVSLARSGEQALRLLGSGLVPDIILLDINMPEMDGYQTLQRIKTLPALRNIPVIFLTGVSDTESEVKGLGLGAIDYITKPFVKDILLARVRLHISEGLRRRRALGEAGSLFQPNIDEDKFRLLAERLTDTETRVARLILLGMTNQEIGDALHYSYAYVKKVTAVVFEKAGVNKRSELRALMNDSQSPL